MIGTRKYSDAVRSDGKMNRSDFVSHDASRACLTTADAKVVLGEFCEAIHDALMRGESVTIAGFGTVSMRGRTHHDGRNPRTGVIIAIAAA